MNLGDFNSSLIAAEPPGEATGALAALWWLAKGDWHAAHALAQAQDDAAGAWVHAHLHRVEGDEANAGYWYRRAGRPRSSEPLDAEWAAIAEALLAP